jgi:3-deoxy-D-arabino-heptulosonate 7-phosphate (DAHP) synthase
MGVYIVPTREQALANFYSSERRAGACPIQANERMAEFAKRLDALEAQLEYDVEVEMVRQVMERKS